MDEALCDVYEQVLRGSKQSIPFLSPVLWHFSLQGEELVARDQRFENMNMKRPEVEATLPPEFISRAGSQADKILLLPAERRAIMEMKRWDYFSSPRAAYLVPALSHPVFLLP
jgi:hypothetical protein